MDSRAERNHKLREKPAETRIADVDSAISREEMRDLKLWEKISKRLSDDGPQRVLLTGQAGIGKTWLARMVDEHVNEKRFCYQTIWLHLNNKFEDELSLYENIAFQIEVYDRDDDGKKEKDELLKDLKQKIRAELERKKESVEMKSLESTKLPKNKQASSEFRRPYILLILDDEGNKTSELTVMNELGFESFLQDHTPRKVVITRRIAAEDSPRRDGEIESFVTDNPQEAKHEENIITDVTADPYCKIKFRTTDESEALLDTLTEGNVRNLFESLIEDEARELLESLQKDWKIDEPLTSRVVRKSIILPAAVVMLAKSLNCITQKNTFKRLSPIQEKVLRKALFPSEPAYSDCEYNPVLHLAYELLETDETLNNAIVDCFWHSLDFFKHCGCVHHNELITQWILEGYFDPVRSVKMAYKDGYETLFELIERGILKIYEGDMVAPEMAMKNLIDLRHHGLLGRSRLRFASVYGGDKNKGLGTITQIDDMIKTVQARNGTNIQTLLVSGNRLRRETPMKFFKQMKDLEVLGLFAPTVDPLLPSLKDLKKLRVLVIRDYDLLDSIETLEVESIRKLEVLEVSGASSLRNISDEFFKAASELQSLNLSGLHIYNLPPSISLLRNLRCLILRDCPVLKNFPGIQHLVKLEVVDVRGAHMLRTCFGMRENPRRNRSFFRLQKLQILDFSETKIIRLPIFQDAAAPTYFHSLTRLSLKNCSNLRKLPNLKPLSGLQILDLSGTTNLVDIAAVCFEEKAELKILNLSWTKLTKLPFTISELSNLSQLLLRGSSKLEALPNIERLTSLEVFDVSGCTTLHKIEGSFRGMSYLHEVNLSGTKIKTLPELPEKSSIYCLKVVVLEDARRLIHDTWSQVKEAITNGMFESPSSYDMVNSVQEISRKDWGCYCPERKGCPRGNVCQENIYSAVYMNTIPFVDSKSCKEVLEIKESNGPDHDKETLAKAEFVVFVDYGAASLSPIFSDLKSVKGCWLEMCGNIENLLSGVNEERLVNLETLSITNLQRLKSICGSGFKNLKKLNLECCPSIITLFPDTSQLPSNLEVLKIKFCEKLEKVFPEEVILVNLHTLCLLELPVLSTIGARLPNLVTNKKEKCPMLKEITEISEERE